MSREVVVLRPHDVCVALQFALSGDLTYRDLSERVSLSLGEAHNSARRLEVARLVRPGEGTVNRQALLEFLVHGVPYVFPGQLGPETRGVPTAHAGPALREHIQPVDPVVWPAVEGEVRGAALEPLCPGAPRTLVDNPPLYRLLTVVDALRVGRAREKKLARDILHEEIDQLGRLAGAERRR